MQAKKIWIGRWIVFVAIIHTVFGLVVGGKVVSGLVERGFFNAMGSDPMTGYIVWFVLVGPVLALLGMAVTVIERSGQSALARPLGIGLLMLATLGVVLMPVSGFWLMYPAVYGLLRGTTAARLPQPSAQ